MGEAIDRGASWPILVMRLAVGVAAGGALYGLHRAFDLKVWPASDKPLFAAMLLAAALTPFVLLAGLGHLRRWTLAAWTVVAAGLCAWLGGYAAAQVLPADASAIPEPQVWLAAAAALFVAHHLIAPADAERRLTAPYARYFDAAWLDGVRLGLAIAFTGAFWILLFLGASLFELIGLGGLGQFIQHDWFAFPATGVVFAAAVQLADARAGLTRGLRTVGLVLLSWLLPVMGLIAIAFLFALPFTGLAVLWRAGAATGVLLAGAAALIVLINAAYQDGDPMTSAPVVLRWAARLTALALIGLVGVAAWGLALRIGQHGLTPDRIIAAACALAAACYALGYGYGAVRPGRWMIRLEGTNVGASFVVLALIVALFTGIADPARIAVDDQMARLQRGAVAPARFDFRFLRFDAGRHGLAALKRLAAEKTGAGAAEVARLAAQTLALRSKYDTPPAPPQSLAARIAVYPKGARLPADFLDQTASDHALCMNAGWSCEAYLIDLDGDGSPEVVVNRGAELTAYAKTEASGKWGQIGTFAILSCPATTADLRAGQARTVPPQSRWKDLEAGGQNLRFMSSGEFSCPRAPAARPRGASAGPEVAR